MIQKKLKKYKINQLTNIKQKFEYIYIIRYYNFNINEMIYLKKKMKKFKFYSFILKQKLINDFFINIKGQGPILIIYGNENNNIINEILKMKKISLIYLKNKNNVFSYLKLKKIIFKKIPLNFSIIKPIFNFLYYLKKINKANIT